MEIKTIILAVVFIIAGIVAHICSECVDGYLSNIGSMMSIMGSIIAIQQIWKLRDKTEEVNRAIEDTSKSIFLSSIENELTILNTMIDEIEAYVRIHNAEATLLKLKQLNDVLKKLSAYVKNGQYSHDGLRNINMLIRRFNVNICILSNNTEQADVDWGNLIIILEEAKSKLISVINRNEIVQ